MTDEQIEKAAQQHANNVNYPCAEYGWYESDDEQMKECLADVFKAGAQYALSHQWVSVEERLPPGTCLLMCINARGDKGYALCVYIRGRFMIYDHTLSYKREFYPTHWMKVPQLNPEKQLI